MLEFVSSSEIASHEEIELGHRLDAIAIGTTTCLATFMTGFITLKFLHFLSISDSKDQRFARCLGTAALVMHMAQLLAQLENTWTAMTRFATSTPFNVFLYEGIETLFTLFIVIVVQIHFARIVRAFIKNKRRWSIFAAISCTLTCMAGLTTSAIILSDLSHGRLKKDTPPKLSVQLTICWATWLTSATAFDITVLSVLTKNILKHRAGTVQVSFKSLLSRILLVTIYAFLMTSLTSIVAVILIIVSTISTNDNFILLSRLRIAAFVSNSFLPRIYLLAFCSSLVGKRQAMDSKTIRYSIMSGRQSDWS
ncbi:hypothetical protein H4Q26_010883 [Puccinia striiformis f. sp. tritici PST-130]|uniref:G-protein coupled receptors family 1 profile domain-containing protein n=1 Tax=Puccinia striiformis f. sp. tritici PST-78 TaxID=1165861 RepID=A0A0L0W4G6_9BASI|nr:hypothetical protein Pst134EB_027306 [Puccinia striiformis f. sp. tritici]KAI9616488.1 hypothetical protein H4Q26_010883 [Puccinia striiformis f. sp. tritici PST-130]KNF06175.1 hypothetical protein PSTG_00684 [Puccinia striiformis f. sp. tritici PST-78]